MRKGRFSDAQFDAILKDDATIIKIGARSSGAAARAINSPSVYRWEGGEWLPEWQCLVEPKALNGENFRSKRLAAKRTVENQAL